MTQGAVQRPRDTADVRDALRAAAASKTTLRLRGGGTWLDAGRPVAAQATLDLSSLDGVVEYVPGDLTLTARAATPLATLDDLTRANGQWLPLDPFGSRDGTIGATLATASAGPLGAAVGLPRDLALGMEYVTGDGTVARGGGRVVKNVAGFDMVRLMTGAWGTLAVLTEITVRLRALPEAEATLALPVPHLPAARAALVAALRDAPLASPALEMLDAPLAAACGAGDTSVVLVQLTGNAEAVDAQRRTLANLGEVATLTSTAWRALRGVEPHGGATFRLSRPPSDLPELWSTVMNACADLPGAMAHAAVERGVVRVMLPEGGEGALARVLPRLASAGHLVAERLPRGGWAQVAAMAQDPLSARLRRAFDPAAILNPGILGGTS